MFSFSLARTALRNSIRPYPNSGILGIRAFRTSVISFNNANLTKKPIPNNEATRLDRSSLAHIPGERQLTNDLKDRLPKFPLSREAAPTLIPRPGVPRAGENGMTFGQMIHILKNKTEPELIYEAEPHKLYFIFCGCFALVFAFYAWNIGLISFKLAWDIFKENNLELPLMHQYINTAIQFGIAAVLTSMPVAVMFVFIMAPTRLIRRMWYLPGEVEHVQFVTHPLLPSSPSPIVTIPLANLTRAHKTKVWTGRGFYGTIDSTIFFFLREKGSRIPWIVDRKGFFWGDGRVYDHLFGKETITEAERGLSTNDKADIARHRLKAGEEKLKQELGVGWRYKAQGQLLKEDIKNLKKIMVDDNKLLKTGAQPKKLPRSNQLNKNSD